MTIELQAGRATLEKLHTALDLLEVVKEDLRALMSNPDGAQFLFERKRDLTHAVGRASVAAEDLAECEAELQYGWNRS